MAITRASDHTVTGLSDERYCTVRDVINQLRQVAPDDNDLDLGAWLSAAGRDDAALSALVDARYWVEDKTGSDFDYHEDVAVELDGSGEGTMHLDLLGFVPLLEVTLLTVGGNPYNLANFATYQNGLFKYKKIAPRSRYTRSLAAARAFPDGTQNVAMTLTWGYPEYPYDLRMAQAKRAAAILLLNLEIAQTQAGDVSGGLRELTFDDFSIKLGSGGRYTAMVAQLQKDAKETCFRYRIPGVEAPRSEYVGIPSQPGG